VGLGWGGDGGSVVVEAGGFASPVWFTVHALFLNILEKIEK
jgi:hypothetical protein